MTTNDRGIVPVIGIDDYLQRSLDEQQMFKDIYNGGYNPIPQILIPLSTVIVITQLHNFDELPRYERLDRAITDRVLEGRIYNQH